MNIKIVVATHKKYWMPNDLMYVPIHVGAERKAPIGYLGDNTGENISVKNNMYRELTGMYWGKKNLEYDYFGLAHYRRHFCYKKKGNAKKSILTKTEAEKLLATTDIIVPKRRKYYIETLQSHFNHMRLSKDDDLVILKAAVTKISPYYGAACDVVYNRTWGHMFNMFIMKKDIFRNYYEWFFAVLAEVENNIDMSSSIHSNRSSIIGYVAEFLLDIYLEANHLPYKEINTVFLEKQNEIKKIYKFFIRKFRRN
jgi:hypothetical protein